MAITDSIVELLKDSKLYSFKKIEWMIDNCNKRIESNAYTKFVYYLKSIYNIIIPIISLFLGAVIAKFNSETMIYCFVIVITIVMIGLFLWWCLESILDRILFPDKECYKYLLDELGYIKTNIEE